jgi:hypothetical protein
MMEVSTMITMAIARLLYPCRGLSEIIKRHSKLGMYNGV